MEEKNTILIHLPICSYCNEQMRMVGDVNMMEKMEKGLNASLTLQDKKNVRMYVCEKCRRVEFYMP